MPKGEGLSRSGRAVITNFLINEVRIPVIIITVDKFSGLIPSNRNQQFPYNQAISIVVV
ncbi:RNA-binding protein Hfq [Bacillus cereus]|uniref:RNA-binding protein Hfq n=3 Tax=Bacillus cereus TaxID=1396 RepID=A0A9X6VRH1_BACCE|nr:MULTISPECIES: RNA chaperone Hfq [Bacillus cereus group]MDF9494942.1 RNA chaperone Hfq [Bacillus cereus]MEE3959839.1 RNA chaperone Hfq [Bacillus thuringiensis]PEF48791.1 RNA-binding protein Hfq [Bacillus thuringiensis]PEG01456.1 RNA-binding protein Hfq [Bacillus cereus]PER14678.1 RNA-binding protein Hfq [Bacillus cereus]